MHRVDWIVCCWVVNAYGIAAPAFFVGGPTIQQLKLVSHLFPRLFDVDAQTLGLLQKLLFLEELSKLMGSHGPLALTDPVSTYHQNCLVSLQAGVATAAGEWLPL